VYRSSIFLVKFIPRYFIYFFDAIIGGIVSWFLFWLGFNLYMEIPQIFVYWFCVLPLTEIFFRFNTFLWSSWDFLHKELCNLPVEIILLFNIQLEYLLFLFLSQLLLIVLPGSCWIKWWKCAYLLYTRP
jgi:hypothetical protein